MPVDPTKSGPPPSRHRPDRTWTYKSVGDSELKAFGFSPREMGPQGRRAAFLFFHPGGWSMGEPAWGFDLCHRYAGLGMEAISFQYRLSSIGGHTPADAVSDARSAIRWARRHAGVLGIDPNRLIGAGISAGAHLVLCAAMLGEHDDPEDDPALSPVPNALVLQCAPVASASDSQFAELLQGRAAPEELSPAHHVKPGLPPMCLVHSKADEIVPYGSVKEFVTKMQEAGNRCELYTFEEADHFFSNRSDQAEALKLMDGFLRGLGYLGKSSR
jgi:acetyl esterase